MFDTFDGLPLHPLATHAAVVLIPLAGVLGLLFAWPRTRRWATWPLPLVSLLAALATVVAVQSGEALERVGGVDASGLGGPVQVLVDQHAELADQLNVLMWVYAGLAVLAAAFELFARRRVTDAASTGQATEGATEGATGGATVATTAPGRGTTRVGSALGVLLVVGAVLLGLQTYRVGDAGARAVWNPAGGVDYSAGD